MKYLQSRTFLTLRRDIVALLLVIFAIAFTNFATAQDKNGHGAAYYEAQWAALDKLLDNGSYNSAYDRAQQLFAAAQQEHDSRATLAGAYYMGIAETASRENAEDSILQRYQRILPALQPLEQAVCHTLLARCYYSYKENNAWTLRNNKATDEPDLDFKLWPAARFDSVIVRHQRAALAQPALLQRTPAASLAPLLQPEVKDEKARRGRQELTPTLYDVLVNEIINQQGDAQAMVAYLRGLIAFHAHDNDTLRLSLDLHYEQLLGDLSDEPVPLNSMSQPAVPCLTPALMDSLIAKYKGTRCPLLSQLYYDKAKLYDDEEKAKSLLSHPEERLKTAVAICQEGYRLFPESEGGAACYNMIQRIQQPIVEHRMQYNQLVQRNMLAGMTVKNVSAVYFRIVKYVPLKNISDAADQTCLAGQKALQAWQQTVPARHDYQAQNLYAYLPPMPAGKYYLLASYDPTFKEKGLACTSFSCADAVIVATSAMADTLTYRVLNRKTGVPLPGVRVELRQSKSYYDHDKSSLSAARTTDADGHVSFLRSEYDNKYNSYWLKADYEGAEVRLSVSRSFLHHDAADTLWNLFTDRPVYKPGDTVAFSALCCFTDRRHVGTAAGGATALLTLKDCNRKSHDTLRITTDALGVAHGRFVLPADALPGSWRIDGDGQGLRYCPVKVENYKQPKFMVSLRADSSRHRFGQPVTVSGSAVSYTAMPVAGAAVSYSITRCAYSPYWWRNMRRGAEETIAGGSAATRADGTFQFSFVPTPDASSRNGEENCFEYTVTAQVTDPNGESHEQRLAVHIGDKSALLALTMPADARRLDTLRYQYLNLDGAPVGGTVQLTVQELTQPAQPLLQVNVDDNLSKWTQTLSRAEFAQRYPLYAYDAQEMQPSCWPVRRTVATLTHAASAASAVNAIAISKELPSGVYRIVATLVDADGQRESDSAVVTVTRPDAPRVQSSGLVWHDLDAATHEVGDTLLLRCGSRFHDVHLFCSLYAGDSLLNERQLLLDDGIATLRLPVTAAMRGDFSILLMAVKENVVEWHKETVHVPYTNKQLTVRLSTFRDKLQPGSRETWSFSLLDAAGQAVPAANLMLTMYDAALDSYGDSPFPTGFNLWARNYFSRDFYDIYRANSFGYSNAYFVSEEEKQGQALPLHRWTLASPYAGSPRQRKYMRNAVSYCGEEDAVVEECVVAETDGASMASSAAANREAEEPIIERGNPETKAKGVAESAGPLAVQSRTKLSTLAFFEPQLRTDDSGRATLTFTVPELLTQWHLQGIAHTRDLKVGSLSALAVTAKELMVVPNVPRFLRQGDQLDFMVKVSNASEEAQSVTVTLAMSDAASGLSLPMILPAAGQQGGQGEVSQQLTLAARGSATVTFRLQVPAGDLYAAQYRVTARGAACGDGEQAVIPVLSNRTLVTESMAMYLNGKGEKHYTFQHLKDYQSATLQPHALTAECTANPVWYAVQALPYLQEQENPSNLYLAGSVYANALGAYILRQNPQAEQMFRRWCAQDSAALTGPLEQNAEVKQTLMEETPWLRDAQDETARQRRTGLFFDRAALQRTLAATVDKLSKSQKSNGAWSWIPDGRYESEYVTAYVLKTFGHLFQLTGGDATLSGALPGGTLSAMLRQALSYVDDENYKYYKECLKTPRHTPTNVDYLYLRSFYPKEKLQARDQKAYDFFYANALKDYASCNGLYAQAQLALVFARHGDGKEARDLIRRLKERSLTDDEMGMYWRDNVSGYHWNERPIEVQSLLIEAFLAATPEDQSSVALMRQWLLKQKQTTRWESDLATVHAIQALMAGGADLSDSAAQGLTLTVGGAPLTAARQSGTGYQRQRWSGDSLSRRQADVTLTKRTDGIAWGAMYWQYFEDLDKVPYSAMGIKMKKTLYRLNKEGDMSAVNGHTVLKVGDKVRVRILIDCDRNLEYLELNDARAAALEPVSSASGWRWNDGLSYYVAVRNAASQFFIDRLDKGQYLLEYDLYVNGSGDKLSAGSATIQCLYSPAFRCTTPGLTLQVLP